MEKEALSTARYSLFHDEMVLFMLARMPVWMFGYLMRCVPATHNKALKRGEKEFGFEADDWPRYGYGVYRK